MDVVADLVTGPFAEIIEKGTAATGNAGDNKDMLSECQKLVKGAERCLRSIEPLCARHLEESGTNFIDALKDNNEIAEYRLQLTDMLWDFDDYMEEDTFEQGKYVELRELCKKAGVRTLEVLKRMRLETAQRDSPAISAIAASPPAVTVTQEEDRTQMSPPPIMVDTGALRTQTPGVVELETKTEPIELEPPPPPPNNPWDLTVSPNIDTGAEFHTGEMVERRLPVSAMSSPVSEPNSPEHDRRVSHGSNRRLDVGGDRFLPEDERLQQISSQDIRSPVSPTDRTGLAPRGRTSSTALSAPIPEEHAVHPGHGHRYSQGSSIHSHPSRQRSQESMQSSIFDSRKNDGAASPSMTEHRGSGASGYDAQQISPSSRPIIPPRFPSGVQDGIERVPLVVSDGEGLIPVEAESSQRKSPPAVVSTRQKDCGIGLSSSFYLYKGFCDGAKEVVRGGLGIKKVKKPGFSGAHVVAKCESCFYELDFKQLEQDINNAEDANYILNKIGFRLRFLQKSHIATKRADELLFGCVFCIHSQRTLEECDATVFFSQKKLFDHLARHPRPLPQVPGITVVEGAEMPFTMRNNYDLHFRTGTARVSPLEGRQNELAQLPQATATQTVKRMYGMRLLYDQTPAFELANGARVCGVEFPSRYNGEWVMGWHEGNYGSAPVDVLKLEAPPRSEVRMDTTSNISAVARWRFAPKSKDGGDWLKFDQGERITNISWAWQDHWCWSGTNAKGTWGIFPQTHIDSNTLRENSDRSSISSGERRRSEGGFFGRLTSRKNPQRPPSVAEVMVSSGPRPSVF